MIKYSLTRHLFCLLLVLVSAPSIADEMVYTSQTPEVEALPSAPTDVDMQNQTQSNSAVADETWSGRAREVLVSALSLTGIRYKYGGNTPETGFDCSGFVRYVFKQASSLTLPHSALALSQLGKSIPKNELQPGDLVFFNTLRNTFSHVGIYLGNNRFIHAPRTGANVRVESMKDGYWAKRFTGAKRIDENDSVKE